MPNTTLASNEKHDVIVMGHVIPSGNVTRSLVGAHKGRRCIDDWLKIEAGIREFNETYGT